MRQLSRTTLEETYFFPILDATPASVPHGNLHRLQCGTIHMLHTLFGVCHTRQSLDHAIALNMTIPKFRQVWQDARAMGLPSLLDTDTTPPSTR